MITARDGSHSIAISGDPHELAERIRTLHSGAGLIIQLSAPSGAGKREFVHNLVQLCPGWFTHRVSALPWLQKDQGNIIAHLAIDDVASASHLIVIDDAQWADRQSIEELCTLTRRLTSGRVVLILSLSTEDSAALAMPLHDIADYSLSLPPLTLAGVHEMCTELLGISLSAGTCSRLLEITGGRPGRVREILSSRNRDYWRADDVVVPIPDAWQALYDARSQNLSGPAILALRCLAIFHGSCPLDLLSRIAKDPQHTAIDELVGRNLIGVHTTATGLHVAFSHITDLAVLRTSLSPGDRSKFHRIAATYFAECHDVDQSLRHRAKSTLGCHDTYARLLADRAERIGKQGAWQNAREIYEDAAELARDRLLRVQLRLDAIEATIAASDIASASVLSSGMNLISNSPRIDSMLGGIAVHEGRRSEARALLDPISKRFSELDPLVAARLGVRMTLMGIADWAPSEVVKWAELTTATSPEDNESRIEAEAIALVGRAALDGKKPPRHQDKLTNLPFQAQRLNMAYGWINLVFDDPVEARDQLRVTYEGEGSERIALWQDAWLARANFLLGDLPAASSSVERGLARAERFGIPVLQPLLLWTGAYTALYRGDHDLMRFYTSRLVSRRDAFAIQRIPSLMCRMVSGSLTNDVKSSVRAGEQLLEFRRDSAHPTPGFWPWEDVFLQALLRDGQTAKAETVLEELTADAQTVDIPSLKAKLAVPQGNLLFQQGRISKAMKLLDDAVDAISALPLPAYESRIVYEYGQLLRRHGQRRRADEMLSRAAELFSELGAESFVHRSMRERRAVGLGPRNHSPSELTPQELEIAHLVAQGATNRDAANELYLSTKTVEYHLTRVYRKLAIRGRSELSKALQDLF